MCSAGKDYVVSLLSELQKTNNHSDIKMCSENRSVSVHSSILSKCSNMVANMLITSESKLIILPGFSSILSDFATLVYTGQAANLSKQDLRLLTSLCTDLGIETFSISNEDRNTTCNTVMETKVLKVSTELLDECSQEIFPLRFPISRKEINKNMNIEHQFEGFERRIQNEYNRSPIGP